MSIARRSRVVALLVMSLVVLPGCRPRSTRAPRCVATPRHPVATTYHGVRVVEDYRWLERTDGPAVRAWIAAQNRCARRALDALPGRAAIAAQLTGIFEAGYANYREVRQRGGTLFAIRNRPGAQQPFLVALPSADRRDAERVVVDPNVLDPEGRTAIALYTPSHDGQRVAVALARDGSEVGTLHFYEVATGRELGDTLERVTAPTGGGSVEWDVDGNGVLYTRYPHAGERPAADQDFYQQIYHHVLGTPVAQDAYVLGREFPRIAECELRASRDGARVLVSVANGDGGEVAHWLRGPSGAWQQVTRFEDGATEAALAPDGALYLVSHRDAPRGRVLRLAPDVTRLDQAAVVVPESPAVIQAVVPTEGLVYVEDLAGGPSQVRVFDPQGQARGTLQLPVESAVDGLLWTTGDEVLYRAETYLTPPAWYRASPALPAPAATALQDPAPVRFDDAEVRRESARSRDGTTVPVVVIRRRGTRLDGSNPTLLGGYGGFGVSMVPRFQPLNRLWLDRGGAVAIAVLRGGGEFGEDWHRAGNLTNKQHVFDDFIAAATHLVEARYTTPARLAIRGASNGGLLMGAVLTQRPDLFRAAWSGVGIYDMLRVQLDPNGAFNTTEYGRVEDPAQFRALYGYSPYHHVVDGRTYPAVLLTTGEHDGRVNPAHSYKFAARLQAAAAPGRPVLLRVSARTGHGLGSSLSEMIGEQTDLWAFLFHELGMTTPAR